MQCHLPKLMEQKIMGVPSITAYLHEAVRFLQIQQDKQRPNKAAISWKNKNMSIVYGYDNNGTYHFQNEQDNSV